MLQFLYKLVLTTNIGRFCYFFFNKKWYFDQLYSKIISQKVMTIGYKITFKYLDRFLIELLGPMGVSNNVNNSILGLKKNHTGYIYHAAFIMLISMILIILFILFFGL